MRRMAVVAAACAAVLVGIAGAAELKEGWSLIKEGKGAGTVEGGATRGADAGLLHIVATVVPGVGEGRVGAVSSVEMPVAEGKWYDVTFGGLAEKGSIGLVFSLEDKEGKVLARTTLPEIGRQGRGGRGGVGAAGGGAVFQKYLVSLHARGTGTGHVVVTPIEATDVWLSEVKIVER